MPRIRIRLAARPLWMYRVLMAWRQHRVGAWLGGDASESGCMVQIVQFHQLELSISLAENLELDRSMAFGTAPDTIHGTARDSHYARDRVMYGGGRGQIWVWSFGLSTLVIAHALIPPQSPQPWTQPS